MENQQGRLNCSLAGYEQEIAAAENQFNEQHILQRIWQRDSRVWNEDPAEISDRLGWLDSPEASAAQAAEIVDFAAAVKADGYTNALLLGMGGSSLAAEVFSRAFGAQPGSLQLEVLDSTHPGAVLACAARLDPEKTIYIVATKSGGTVETFSFMKFFYNQALAKVGREKVGRHFIAITDPGSGLERAAGELSFRRIFLNEPDIGGRYSALSLFGIVPAALLGIDIRLLLNRAAAMARLCQTSDLSGTGVNAPGQLGLIMGQMALAGRNKLTFIIPGQLAGFADWLEQLIAESTGKTGKGILPVVGERMLRPDDYARDRLFVYLHLQDDPAQAAAVSTLRRAGHPVVEISCRDVYDLGGEFFRWEMATAIACWRMGVQPFNQPDVEAAKILARKMLADCAPAGKQPQPEANFTASGITVYAEQNAGNFTELLFATLGQDATDFRKKGNDYIAIQAYIQPDEKARQALHEFRTILQQKYKTAVTIGFGPRFLHSTGQLHKGDAGRGLFIQVLSPVDEDAPIPEQAGSGRSAITFGALITAQAFGDRQALLEKNRRVITLQLTGDEKTAFAALSRLLANL